jgi:hypothetical protein
MCGEPLASESSHVAALLANNSAVVFWTRPLKKNLFMVEGATSIDVN